MSHAIKIHLCIQPVLVATVFQSLEKRRWPLYITPKTCNIDAEKKERKKSNGGQTELLSLQSTYDPSCSLYLRSPAIQPMVKDKVYG